MVVQENAKTRRPYNLNGFLRRWRRNSSYAGVVTIVLTTLLAALAVFAICACKAIGSGSAVR